MQDRASSRRRRVSPIAFGATLVPLLLFVFGAIAQAQEADSAASDVANPAPRIVDIYLFHGEGCPHCANAIHFLNELREDHPTLYVHDYEIWSDDSDRDLVAALAAAYGRTVQGVPMIFLGDEVWTGFDATTARDLRVRVEQYERIAAPDPLARIDADLRAHARTGSGDAVPPPETGTISAATTPLPSESSGITNLPPVEPRTEMAVPFFGTIDLATTSLLVSTVLIGLVDGVNPCSLWVLALLLGVVLGSGSRRRVLIVGGTFLILAAGVYAAFIAGMFEILAYLSLLGWIRVVVAVLAGAIAAIHLKDYVAFGRGVSLTTPDSAKPGIYRGIRRIVRAEGSLPMTLAATGALAIGVTLVELPCTIGLPVIWSALVADAGVGRPVFAGLLSVYMLLYLLDELVIFGVAVVTLRSARVGERGARVLKLLSGSVMLALAVAMLQFPEALGSLTGTTIVFGSALAASGLILIVHRWLAPQSSPFGSATGKPST